MKEPVKDLLFTDDLVINGGDFVVAESDDQHVEHILIADKGQFRQWPLIGVGVARAQNGSINRQAFSQLIRSNLVYDNFSVKSIRVSPGERLKVSIDAKRLR